MEGRKKIKQEDRQVERNIKERKGWRMKTKT